MKPIKPIVFVASPLAGPDETMNIDFARRVCRRIALETGAVPYAPHLLFPQFLNDKDPVERELGISYCSAMLAVSKFAAFAVPVWRDEPSKGMHAEFAVAKDLRVQWGIGFEHRAKPNDLDLMIRDIGVQFPKVTP